LAVASRRGANPLRHTSDDGWNGGVARSKSVVVTFRVDAHLAEALERLPDKSRFIRDAVKAAFHETCPACGGEGRVDCDAAKWLGDVLKRNSARRCSCCGGAFPPALASGRSEICGHCGPGGHRH
jgi:hypothetical protein